MSETRRRYDAEFREGAVRVVSETGKPVAQVARELGINPGTLGSWVNRDRTAHGNDRLSVDERTELNQLRTVRERRDASVRRRPEVVRWRRTVGGWVFAIGAGGPPPDQWEYDGPEPPTGFPGEDPGWGTSPHRQEANVNW